MTTSRTHADGLLMEESLTHQIIGAFFYVFDRLGFGFRKQLLNYLRASRMEVGLLLNFGPKAQFERLVYSNCNKPMLAGR